MDEKKIHLTGRVDQAVRDYFQENPAENLIIAKNLMDIFIQKEIFKKDHRAGSPIRNLLRELDAENKLNLLKHCKVVRKSANRNWYFERGN
ncbi:hypothetical protein DIU31_028240 [Mucilaginibacter rubeus]|uniref:Uncharacterized protein n=1 Tax=Mucilaginibacter rubeus TaxID=2027860 RepID=A0AAE6JKV8_9SPHI|nr:MULTISPECIES: hypothetical protein [Mucilaginibacter]QEM07198.1 hypothetical protein DIU31_028240 [Mucilaginibacter rubeus]QEM19654.1 hypothetical protein DIU38_027815 [Mucilaginibacter gossypii]QTE43650.1 hypothetical protein J3L19_32815 [Mucilaginibacter rubeus]QTE50250.1 hypothetical protein J3L21_32770 [Mucilaginibacter rubeus]QTE55338.1 hypothetical protein J3L23_24390 [Mucilaginibacter rubeus]